MPTTHRHRVIFIDLARALAVVLMVAGHTSSALLATRYRTGAWFDAWVFQRGLTSALFLLLAGFAFSIATARHWTTHLRITRPVVKRVARFGSFVALGYALHLPLRPVWAMADASDAQWRMLWAVDVLQLIGVTLLMVQALVLVSRTRPVFMAAAFLLAGAMIFGAQTMWDTDWTPAVASWVAAYFSPSTGSQFPLFPWAAYVFIGAGAGQLYARWGAANLETFARWGMLAPGALLLGAGLTFLHGIPGDVALRTGCCFLALGVIAFVSRRISQLPRVFGAVAQESLVVYFVHLCIVYGSIWNVGLAHFFREALGPGTTLIAVAGVVAPMIALAFYWNRLKHGRPRAARWVSVAAGVFLIGFLL